MKEMSGDGNKIQKWVGDVDQWPKSNSVEAVSQEDWCEK